MTVDKPADEPWSVWAYYAVALFGAAMTPYEVFFFSSGGVEERWSVKDLTTMRLNVFIGFPLGGVLSLAIAGCTAVVFGPLDASVDTLGQVGLPVAVALGKVGLAVAILGLRGRHARRGVRDRAVDGLQHRPVLRVAVGQVRQAARGVPVPPACWWS